ncbi:uncharacterized protein LOC106055977 [Biomphalaria glabrata]|uniref:Uncharacterized protein LOC106055977 n=1 Tax=Biomphalaria glabrata TaxID=6526 RepID=A0A9W2YHC5_BIOGL|nr:uncharacterized protein LOC106055977 [Biomphalaria glabrata]XP_055862080.1 uncharacterized protein LOC106055977 [Biomphalaria glabrata]XP_055862081.1 uncharacterized protein LOC106055977 [Biomphalaria glabrata]XP_055862082.1 uncharacterized protein LOC106055977 [Biomphalaria glabrata]
MDYNSIEKSIRCFVSRSDVNVITKRMVRTEFMKQQGLLFMSSSLEKNIDRVLHNIIQELTNLLKQGQPLESLRLIEATNTKVEPSNIPLKTHEKCKVNLNASNIKNASKTKLVNSYSTQKNEIHIEDDRSKSNLDQLNCLKKKTKSSEHLEEVRRRNHNHCFRDLFSDKHYSNSLTAKSVKKNRLTVPKYFSADEVRLSILNSDDSQQSCDSICSEQFLPDRAEVFSSWEEEVALLDSNNTHTSDCDCDQEESKGNICVKVVNSNVLANDSESQVNDDDCVKVVNSNVLANDSESQVNDDDCVKVVNSYVIVNDSDCDQEDSKVNDDDCVEIVNCNVLLKDCYRLDSKVREVENMSPVTSKKNEVIVIDSSPDIDTTKMKKTKIDGSRNWLSVFSKDDVKSLISTNLFQDSAYKLPIISIEKLENGSSQIKQRHSFTVLKTGCEKTKTVEADSCTSPEKKRRKTSKYHTEKKYSKSLLVSDHSLISFQTDSLKSSQRIKGNILQEGLPMDQESKSKGQSQYVGVLVVGQDASNVENIIDITK